MTELENFKNITISAGFDNRGSRNKQKDLWTDSHISVLDCFLSSQNWERLLDEGARGLREKRKYREENVGCLNSVNESLLKSLDSSMKKNAALVRKLKQLNEGNADSIVNDIKKTNQSKVCFQSYSERMQMFP